MESIRRQNIGYFSVCMCIYNDDDAFEKFVSRVWSDRIFTIKPKVSVYTVDECFRHDIQRSTHSDLPTDMQSWNWCVSAKCGNLFLSY